jgi:hypothetical protein
VDEVSERSVKTAWRRSRRGPAQRIVPVLGAVVAIGTMVMVWTAGGALAANGTATTGSFSVVPIGAPGGLSYFQFELAPGAAAHGSVAIVGQGAGAVPVDVFAAQGVTAIGSGDAYVAPPQGHCAGASCWISGLPGPLTVTGGQRDTVSFTVDVPPGTPSGQYLAGVGVQEAAPSTTSTTKPTKGPSAVTTIERQVVIGVEVTVGSGYPDVLRIKKVTGTRIGNSAGVVITEAEVGRTIEHPKGAVVFGRGPTGRSFPAVSGTVLAGGVTGLRVLTTGVKPGTYAASAYLDYDNGEKVARWSGTITIPKPTPSKPVSIPPHSRVVVVSKGWPGWLVGLVIGAGALLLLTIVLLLWALRRSRPSGRVSPT